ncbi:Protein of uncharacterised function (DUF551) [Klebsiella quasipneumoniae]|uniref:DUF551 domain-containing protein n=1 Tax=Klebsiella quasipneumoniae TaxID=1463165 RepID=UPI000808C4DE|nr:DUF551 domain-containing protein [Klebsiella quasipneumoniae]SBZ06972.1 Protein of uncharacterised function (DUF551) [Klebsiella quasipneumoniae]
MTSKFSIDNRELLQRISSGEAVVGIDFGNLIVRELAAFRLAAMDSETVEMPLDYLQGHKDGLEWAAQLAEANHPETGDWLYDDPIELAKAIRKGPDMPPVQPAPVVPEDFDFNRFNDVVWLECVASNPHMHSPTTSAIARVALELNKRSATMEAEPDRNPVLAYADSYRDMAKQGVESVPIWSVITDLERNIAPLYRRAQPAPVVPDEVTAEDCPAFVKYDVTEVDEAWVRGFNACRAATLQASNCRENSNSSTNNFREMLETSTNSPVIPDTWIPVSERMPPSRHEVLVGCWWGEKPRWCCKWATYIPGHPDAQSSGWLIPGASWTPTHWMPLPAAPLEVK